MPDRRAAPLRTAVVAAIAILTVACGTQPAPGGGSSSGGRGDEGDGKAGGSRIDSGTVLFDDSPRLPGRLRTVLRTEEDRARFPGWFTGEGTGGSPSAAEEVADALKDTDLKTHALVVYSATTGCSKPRSAQLYAEGARLHMRGLDQPKPPPECYAPYRVLAVFEVPRDKLPDKPRFGGAGEEAGDSAGSEPGAPAPAGPGELIAFTKVGSAAPPRTVKTAEVTEPNALNRYLAELPSDTAATLRGKLTDHDSAREQAAREQSARERSPGAPAGARKRPDERRFAFVLTGCRLTGAELHSETGKLIAVPVGGDNVRCVRAEHYVAVFALPSGLVPADPLP